MIKRQELKQKLEPFIYESLQKDEYKIIEFNAIKLLTWNRFDLAFKLSYLDNIIFYRVIESILSTTSQFLSINTYFIFNFLLNLVQC